MTTESRPPAPTIIDHARLDVVMTNLPPRDPEIVERFEALRAAAKAYGHAILDLCPSTAERSTSITKLRESLMWAVGSIAVNQDLIPTEGP
jgi:hypothetical protein